MPNIEFCGNRDCEYRIQLGGMARMTRIYIRDSTDREYKSDYAYKRMKQIFKPIGWLCPYCKTFQLDKEYSKNIFAHHRGTA